MKKAASIEPLSDPAPPAEGAADDALTAALGDALLERYPGAVVVVDWEARPVVMNRAGRALAEMLRQRRSIDLVSLVGKAISSSASQEGLVELDAGEAAISIACSIVPLSDPDGQERRAVLIGRDISLQENLRRTLVESRKRYKDLVECSADFGWETDAEGSFNFVSPQGALGFRASELIGRRPRALLTHESVVPDPLPFEARRPNDDVELWLARADGEAACVLVSSVPRLDDTGDWLGARGVCRDITEERKSEQSLAKALNRERLLAEIVHAIRSEVSTVELLDTAARVTAEGVGAQWCWIYRQQGEDALLRVSSYSSRLEGPDVDDVDRLAADVLKRQAGFHAPLGNTTALILPTSYRDQRNGVIVVARDGVEAQWLGEDHSLLAGIADQLGIAIEQITAQEALLELSRTDDLTGLPNRRAFLEEIAIRIERSGSSGRSAAMFYLDMDNFKLVNDIHGHKQGDSALSLLASELRKKTRATDPIARLGGDEFAVWFDGVDLDTARRKAERMLDINDSLAVFSGDEANPLSISIGVAVFDPESGESVDELIGRADQAMYQIKHNGKRGYIFAEPVEQIGKLEGQA